MQLKNNEARDAVAAAPSLGSRKDRPTASTLTAKPKQVRRAGTVHYEEGGRYLYSHGANGVTVFDTLEMDWRAAPTGGGAHDLSHGGVSLCG